MIAVSAVLNASIFTGYFFTFYLIATMYYSSIPVIIPVLAVGYLVVVYVLLMLVERSRA
jgi:hypothetical protein